MIYSDCILAIGIEMSPPIELFTNVDEKANALWVLSEATEMGDDLDVFVGETLLKMAGRNPLSNVMITFSRLQ